MFRNAWYWIGGRDIGARRKATGRHGPLRKATGHDGSHRTTPGGHYSRKFAYFSRFPLSTLSFPLSTFTDTPRLDGFGTPGVGEWVDYRIEDKCQRAQRATAEPGGAHVTMGNGKTVKTGRRGNWRNTTEPDGDTRNTNSGKLAPWIHLLFAFLNFAPLIHFRHSAISRVSAASKRPVLVGGWDIAGPTGRCGTPRDLTEPRGATTGGY